MNPCYSDAFCLFFDAKTKTVKAFNGSGRSPANLTIAHVRSQGITGNNIPASNLNCVTVPGKDFLIHGEVNYQTDREFLRLCGGMGRHR